MKTITLTDEEFDIVREAVSLRKTALEKFADEQHNYTLACNVSGFVPEAKASALLEQKLRTDCFHYEQLLDVLECSDYQVTLPY